MQADTRINALVDVVQEISLATTLDGVMETVRRAARRLTGADGATFILRSGAMCYYADEEAIAPLWKGQRFPMEACISGWVMIHRQPAVIEDIYADSRIPAEAYRPTFVKSLVMVPIRTLEPIGAIGTYWAQRHQPASDDVKLLQALAGTTSVAIQNVYAQDRMALDGVIATCSHCRKVRDDRGRWSRFEDFLAVHTGANVSPDVCPECAARRPRS